jgi:nucleoside-diphosphate-sugar epimerase
MNIFITGATGYIGFEVAKKFRQAGHRVYGLTRSKEKAVKLSKNEIIPVIGSMKDPESYRRIADKSEILIHAAADYENNTQQLDNLTIDTFLVSSQFSRESKKILYTSGTWVYGNQTTKAVNESEQVNPIKVVSWRPVVEEKILNTNDVTGIVIRPGCVYGKQGDMTSSWFEGTVSKSNFKVVGDGKNRWAMIHVDDLADAYYLAAMKSNRNQVYNVTDGFSYTLHDMAKAVSEVAKFNGKIEFIPYEEAFKQMGEFAEALVIDQLIDSTKAKKDLQWDVKHQGFKKDVDLYLESWESGRITK